MRTHRPLLLVAIFACSAIARAQDNAPKGLDALSDDRLLTELAKRNLNGLLDRAFDQNKTPQPKRDAVKASAALSRLQTDESLPFAEKRKLVADYIRNLPQLLSQITDSASLLADATVLIDHGILVDQQLLEYFGPNATVMNRLQPVADGVQRMLLKAREAADAAADRAQANWPAGKPAWERADQQSTIAEYTRNILSYSSAIARDKANADRDKLLGSAINYLSAFDNEDNPNRTDTRFYISKLQMARETTDSIAAARQGFALVQQKGKPDNTAQQFESRFFIVLTEIAAKNASGADGAMASLSDWIKQKRMNTQPEVQTAIAALTYRINVLKSEQAKAGAEKEKFAQAADDILDKLQQNQPGLRGLIMELLGARVSASTPINKLNNLMLQSLRAKAEAETIKPAGQAAEVAVIERGIEAAREIIRRTKDDKNPASIDSYYVLGFFQQKLNRPADAAVAYLDYVDRYKNQDKDRAETTFNNAIAIVGELHRKTADDPEITKLYDRVLNIAVAQPFNRMEFAFELGRRLQATGKLDDAMGAYEKVPADRKEAADANYFRLVAVHDKLGQAKSDDPSRPALLAQLNALADQVNNRFSSDLATADENRKKVLRARLSQTRLLAADVALRDEKNPKRALELLQNFESTVAGLPNEANLMGEVLLVRVQAFVQEDRVTDATSELVRLAEQRPQQAGQIVFNLLEKLDSQITDAETAKRPDVIGQLERNRAALTPFYFTWIRDNPNPELKKYAYSAAVFDADTQRRAAELTTDESRRAELLNAALSRFKELDAPAQFAQFVALQPSDKQKTLRYDPQVKMGLARVYFAQKNYEQARIPLALLFHDKLLGDGVIAKADAAGGIEQADNPTYWEAFYKLIKSNLALNANPDGMKQWLSDQQLVYGDQLGGARWGPELNQLVSELGIQPAPATSPTE